MTRMMWNGSQQRAKKALRELQIQEELGLVVEVGHDLDDVERSQQRAKQSATRAVDVHKKMYTRWQKE